MIHRPTRSFRWKPRPRPSRTWNPAGLWGKWSFASRNRRLQLFLESSMNMHLQSHRGSSIAWRNAPTKSVAVGGRTMKYRQLGPDTGVPVIFLNHLAAELDRWDPRVVDGIATGRRV